MADTPYVLLPKEIESQISNWLTGRFGQVSSTLAYSSPQSMFNVLFSNMPSTRLGPTTQGLTNFFAANPEVHEAINGVQGSAFFVDPESLRNMGVERQVMGLPELLRPVAARLATRTRQAGGLVLSGLDPKQDPLGLEKWIINVQSPGQFPGANLKVTLDSSVLKAASTLDRLEKVGYAGLQKEATAELVPAEVIAQMEQAQFTGSPEQLSAIKERRAQVGVHSVAPEAEIREQGERARILLALIKEVSPDAQISFRDKGALGQVIASEQQIANVLAYPTNLALRNVLQLGLGPGRGGKFDFATPQEVWRESVNAEGYAYGEQFARGLGMQPGDAAWDATVAATNFVASWYLDPVIVGGKAAAGFKLARETPLVAGAALPRGAAGRLFELIGKSPAEWVVTQEATSRLTKILNIAAKSPDRAPDLIRKSFVNVPGDLADSLATAGTLEEARAIVLDALEGTALKPRGLAELVTQKLDYEARLRELKDLGLEDTPTWANLVTDQNLVAARLNAAVNPQSFEILRGFPRPSFGKAIRNQVSQEVLDGTLSRSTAKVFETLANSAIPGTRISLSRLYQDIPGRIQINPFGGLARPGSVEKSAKAMDDMLRDFGVTSEARQQVVSSLLKAKSQQDWFHVWTREVPQTLQEAIPKSHIPTAVKSEVIQYFQHVGEKVFGIVPSEEITFGGLGRAARTYEPTAFKIDEFGNKVGLPTAPVELSDVMLLPSHDLALDLTGFWRRFIAKEGTRMGKFWRGDLAKGTRGFQGFMDAVTGWWKDALLLGRSPAVLMRTQLEQAARIPAYGYASALNRPWAWSRYLFETGWDRALLKELAVSAAPEAEMERLLGLIARQMEKAGKRVKVKAIAQWSSLPADQAEFISYWRSNLLMHHSDYGLRYLAANGPEKFLGWLKTEDAGKGWLAEMRPTVETMEVPRGVESFDDRLKFFVDRKFQEQRNLTLGDRDLERAILGGRVYDTKTADVFAQVEELTKYADEVRADAQASLEAGQITTAEELFHQQHQIIMEAKSQLRRGGLSNKQVRRFEKVARVPRSVYNPEGVLLVEGEVTEELRRLAQIDVRSNAFEEWLKGRIALPEGDPLRITPPSHMPGFYSETVSAFKEQRGFRNAMYRHTLSRPDAFLSRGPLMRQIAQTDFEKNLALGIPRAAARRQAAFFGASQTGDLMYDLASRTSAQTFFRHLAPFFPAWQEIMETWMWKIPSRMAPVVGHAYLGMRVNQLVRGLESIGIDPFGNVKVPFLGGLLTSVLGGPERLPTFRPKDLNLVTQTVFPGLGPVPGAVLSLYAKQAGGFTETIAHYLMPFGLDVQLGPASINRAYQAACLYLTDEGDCTPPWEVLSPEAQDIQAGFSLADATRQTYYDFLKHGDKPPDPQDFDEPQKFKRANDDWIARLVHASRERAAGNFFARGLFSVFSPAPIYVSDEIKADLSKFYDTLDKIGRRSPEAAALYEQFRAEHPYSDLYLTPSSIANTTLSRTDADSTFEKLMADQKRLLTPEEFVHLGLGLTSRSLYDKLYRADLAQVADNPADMLRNWYQHGDALTKRVEAWDRYLKYDKTFADLWDTLINQYPSSGLPESTIEIERLRQFQDLARIASRDSFYSDAVPGVNFKSLASQFGQALVGTYGEAKDPMGKGINWWFDTVATPLFDKLDALRKEAGEAPTRAAQGVIFDQIRRVFDDQAPVKGPDGLTYPTVEEFLWGNKTTDEQDSQILKWATRPPEWLTAFQVEKVYGGTNPKISEFFDFKNDAERALKDFMAKRGISSSSNQGDALERRTDRLVAEHAASLGVSEYLALSNAAPYQRLRATDPVLLLGTGKEVRLLADPYMGQLFGVVDRVSQLISAQDVLPSGHSRVALAYKSQLYAAIDAIRDKNHEFDELWLALQVAGGAADKPLLPHLAYDSILFDDHFGSGV